MGSGRDGIIRDGGRFASCLAWLRILLILKASLRAFKVEGSRAQAETRFDCYLWPICRSQIC